MAPIDVACASFEARVDHVQVPFEGRPLPSAVDADDDGGPFHAHIIQVASLYRQAVEVVYATGPQSEGAVMCTGHVFPRKEHGL
jgi:hypothetical protein